MCFLDLLDHLLAALALRCTLTSARVPFLALALLFSVVGASRCESLTVLPCERAVLLGCVFDQTGKDLVIPVRPSSPLA